MMKNCENDFYNEDYWMIDTPYRRVFALTYCKGCPQRYMIRQWDPKLNSWYPIPEGDVYWRPLPQPPSEINLSKWIALLEKQG